MVYMKGRNQMSKINRYLAANKWAARQPKVTPAQRRAILLEVAKWWGIGPARAIEATFNA